MSGRGRKSLAAVALASGLAIAGLSADAGRDGAGVASPARVAPVQAAGDVDPAAALELLRVVSKQGHSSHPVWYHDSQIVETGDDVYAAFNGDSQTVLARLRRSDLEILDKTTVNRAPLGGNTDTTGTDTNRHDVPALAADGNGLLHVLYGGGTLSGRSSKLDGPYWRHTTKAGDIGAFDRERRLDIGGGSAFDFETVRDSAGTVHFFGQHGSGDAGSLIELRLTAGGGWDAPRKVIDGGPTAKACIRDGRPRGCNRFAIARSTVGPDGRLHLVWGYSEASLSGKCAVDAGYCDHDLYYAVSVDQGATWQNLSGRVRRRASRAPITNDDRRFRIAAGHIGLFKAISAGDGDVLVVFSRRSGALAGSKTKFALRAISLAGGSAREHQIAAPDQAWDSAPVLRRDGDRFSLWLGTGKRIVRMSATSAAGPWRQQLVYKGDAWSLTGTPSATVPGRQLLLWRGARKNGLSEVVMGVAPAATPPPG
ncbi:MAG: BNR-4 repeat-containing protein [Solirubrobacterales bacterium]